MDPITQAAAGSIAAQIFSKRENRRTATWVGALAGMAPDLDILIQSASDPTVSLLYHRHFTHSLAFIPMGALLCALLLWLISRRRHSFKVILLAATIGYATHGFIDALTSYGTLLYWPFSNHRVAWNAIAIIDPLFTLFLLIGIIWTAKTLSPKPALVFLSLSLIILSFGFYQNHELLKFQKQIANQRGHVWERGRVFPTIGNLFLWRSVYESDGRLHIDALRKFPGGRLTYWEGGSVKKFKLEELTLAKDSQIRKDLAVFVWFAGDYLAELPDSPNTLGDFRYSIHPMGIKPLWGAKFDTNFPEKHIERVNFFAERYKGVEVFWDMLMGQKANAKTLP